MKTSSKVLGVLGALILVGGVAYAMKRSTLSPAEGKQTVLAVVNRQNITTADIDGLVASGLSKPVALEAAIAREINAEAARSQWPEDSQAIADAVLREALSNYYVRRTLAELQKAVKDEDVARYYETNLKDEMYAGQVLKYYLTQDAKDAGEMAEAIRKNQDAALGKFSWVNKNGDHAVMPLAVPYGLYQQVKAMQPGQYAGPFNVRDGLLFLKLEDRKAGQRPELVKVKEEIQAVIAQQRLEEKAKELRTRAAIQLK